MQTGRRPSKSDADFRAEHFDILYVFSDIVCKSYSRFTLSLHFLQNMSKFNWGNLVKHFQNPQKPNRKKVTGLLRSRVEKIDFFQTYYHLLGAPLVTEKI